MVLDTSKLNSYIEYKFKNLEDGIGEFLEYIKGNNEK